MRIAVAGKGGTGKTTLAGILARTLGRTGRPVLAVDCDTNPNLAAMLGLTGTDGEPVPALGRDVVERVKEPDGSIRLALTRPLDEILARHTAPAPDHVRLMVIEAVGHAGAG